MTLEIKAKNDCRWDLLSLGEVLLRFCPGDARIQTAREFKVYDGGGEYNVARTLSKVFRRQTAIVTALADNALGRLAEEMIGQAGADASQILWRTPDGRGEQTRNGIYFIERGSGLRAPASCFDRGNTAVSQLNVGEINWNKIFNESGARWFHTGGIFAGLSATTPDAALEAMRAARASGAIVSFDLNYRDSLWRERGGRDAANRLNRTLLENTDIAFGAFDFEPKLAKYDQTEFIRAAENMLEEFPGLKIVATTLRDVHSASQHNLSAAIFAGGKVFKARDYPNIAVFDRVGSGDAFTAGVIHAVLANEDWQFAVECGAACGALAMTTPGDSLQATESEVRELMVKGSFDVKR